MKWWLKLGLALIAVVAVAILGISGFLGYSMTKVKRLPIEENPAFLGLKYEDVSSSRFTLKQVKLFSQTI